MRLINFILVLNVLDSHSYKSFTDIHHNSELSYVCLKGILDFMHDKKLISKAPSHDQRYNSMIRLNERGDKLKQQIGGWY